MLTLTQATVRLSPILQALRESYPARAKAMEETLWESGVPADELKPSAQMRVDSAEAPPPGTYPNLAGGTVSFSPSSETIGKTPPPPA